jgi:chromate reductase, NAD(P)H dehydrogenase (quinone)
MTKILAIPGSLRSGSSSNQVLKAALSMAPPNVSIEIYDGVGTLPHFNDESNAPEAIVAFRKKIKGADAVLICTPEYAFGVPGSLKNAIDWTVGSGEFVNKPVALVTASSQGEKGHAALLLILTAISARIVPDATLLISFVRAKLDASGNISDPKVVADIKRVLLALSIEVRN